MWKQFVKDYLTFTKKERTAVLVLLAVIFAVVLLPYLWPVKKTTTPDKKEIEELQRQMAQLKKTDSSYNTLAEKDDNVATYNYPEKKSYNKIKTELFYFDPNTLSAEGWMRLGLRDKTIQTIQNYLSKGGTFRRPEDISKIYGLYKDDYEKLLPYVKLKNNAFDEKDTAYKKEYAYKDKFAYPAKKIAVASVIDINTADTTALIALPGIGSKLAGRIVNFRDKLGGFYSVTQVAETYGLPDSTFQKIQSFLQCPNVSVHQLNINTADINALKLHPYIRWNLANVIVQYRLQHGNFKSIDDLQQIAIITPEIFKKIKPYVTINEQ
jgi:competence protein ComEA